MTVGERRLYMGQPHGNNRMDGYSRVNSQFEFLKPKTLDNKTSTKGA